MSSDSERIKIKTFEKILKIMSEFIENSGSEPEGKGFKWNDDLVKRYAEVYRFSSSRTSIEQFKENPDWASQETVNENYKLAMQEVEPEGKEAVELWDEAQEYINTKCDNYILTNAAVRELKVSPYKIWKAEAK